MTWTELRKRVQSRPDSEFNQALIRLAIGALITSWIAFLPSRHTESLLTTSYWLGPGFMAISTLIILACVIDHRISHKRRVFGMLLDFSAAGYLLYQGNLDSAVLIAVYLWVTLGNGFRYGLVYLYGAMLLSVISFSMVVFYNDEWASQPGIVLFVFITLLAIPVYSGHLIKQLYKALAREKEANQAQSRFLSMMSHEIRTPLNGVIGLIKLVLDSRISDKQRDQLIKAENSAQFLLVLLNDVLDYTRMGADQMAPSPITFRLDHLLEAATILFSTTAQNKGVDLFLNIHPDVPRYVVGDAFRLTQIINNLVGNAVKFTDAGEVEIEVRKSEGTMLAFVIRDSGIGIPDDKLKEIFEPFAQADDSIARRHGGSGLGLAITERLVHMLGGHIKLDSQVGRGTRITVTLPFQAADAPEESSSLGLPALRVLIVDGHGTSQRTLENMLTAWGQRTMAAENAENAKALIQHHANLNQPIEMTLIASTLPDMSGAELADWVHHHATSRICLLTPPGTQDSHVPPWLQTLERPITSSSLFNVLIQAKDRPSTQPHDGLFELSRPIHGAHVLLVEDNAINQDVARGFLDKIGVLCETASSGEEALRKVKTTAFDAILMDIQMPGMDGLTAAREILKSQDTPIIALTAAALDMDVEHVHAAGMVDHIAKPIDELALVDALNKWIRRRPYAPRSPA